MRIFDKFKSRRFILGLVIVVVLVGVGGAVINNQRSGGQATEQAAKKIAKYHCPMHPTYTSDRPGDCPICGMKLVLIEDEDDESMAEMPSIEGLATIKLSDAKRQLIGVRTVEAVTIPLTKVIRTVGIIEPDETRLAEVNMKIDGWIEDLYVDYTGQLVKKGQPLLSIYSQELLATQEEYLLALRAQKRLTKSPFPEVSKNSSALVKRARQRLELWDIPDAEIRSIEKSGKPRKTLVLRAPVTGFVMHRSATEGMYVKAGQELYKIADLSRVWVQADIYEYELGLVKVGQRAKLTVASYPDKAWYGKAAYVYPYLESQSRTAKVRFEFDNPSLKLKPNMYVNVELAILLGEQLAVPEEAVMDSGKRQIVFVDNGDGYYEPREVKVGHKVDGKVAVTYGLFEGERVVVNGNFMIDSESRLKAALRGMSDQTEETGGQDHSGHGM